MWYIVIEEKVKKIEETCYINLGSEEFVGSSEKLEIFYQTIPG
jgi:hypothetical protein